MALHFKVLAASGSEADGVHPCSFMLGSELLLDAGSAASQLSIEAQQSIRRIYLTHCHLDHIKDLAFLGENIFSLIQAPIEVYAPEAVLKSIKQHLFNDIIWPDFTKLPNASNPVFRFVPIKEGKFTHTVGNEKITIEAVQVNHPGPTYGYIVTGSKRAVVYTADTGPTQKIWDIVNSQPNVTDILLETSFPNRFSLIAKESLHLTPASLREEIMKIKRREITIHVYHVKVPYLKEIESEIKDLGEKRIRMLKQGDMFELS